MINEVLKTIKKYNMISNNDEIVIGLSGGSDSVTLFHVLRQIKDEYNLKIVVVHINHAIRKESDDDENFCVKLCKKYDIPIYVYKKNIKILSKEMKLTIEEAGRFYRYECFNKHTKGLKGKIAIAHNKNDVVETFLMRAVRGSGLRGLCSIQPTRNNIIRPLIEIDKKTIEGYCMGNNFKFVLDKSNLSTEYTRNKIRLNLIPLLEKQYNQEVVSNLYRTTKLISEEEKFLEELCENYFNNISTAKGSKIFINVEKLKKINVAMQRRVFRYSVFKIDKNIKDLGFKHIEECLNLINMSNGSRLILPNNINVIKEYENICIKNVVNENEKTNKNLEINKIYYIHQKNYYLGVSNYKINKYDEYENSKIVKGKSLRCIKEKQFLVYNYNNLVLRNRMPSDKIYFRHIKGNKKLKKYFIDEKIPRDNRDNILLLTQGNNIFLILDEHLKTADSSFGDVPLYLKLWEEN